ncbi:MAG: hypothetical protein F9B45_15845 [Phycisphaera sp. RhM]|nr:hypothetical protein [Phycisphaera sp. RhM]
MAFENGKMKRKRPSQYPYAQSLLAFSLAIVSACPRMQIPREEYLFNNSPEYRFPTPAIFPKN